VSSIGVFSSLSQIISERTPLPSSQTLFFLPGYSQSKWVAEKLLLTAIQRGFPVSILRPGDISGHSKTGALNETDFIVRLIRGVVQLKAAPIVQVDRILDMSPVDYVSRAIVHICSNTSSITNIFHLVNEGSISVNKLMDYLISFGYNLEKLNYEDWKKLLKQQKTDETALSPLLAYFKGEFPRSPRFSSPATHEVLKGSDIKCPVLSEQLVHLYLKKISGK